MVLSPDRHMHWAEINSLISEHPHSTMIQYLRTNPQLSAREIARDTYPNCHGTVIYTLGMEDELQCIHEEVAYRFGFIDVEFIFPEDRDGPGWISNQLMAAFLDNTCEFVNEPSDADIVTLGDITNLRHVAIPIKWGKDCGLIFHQCGKGKRFCAQPALQVADMRFYQFI